MDIKNTNSVSDDQELAKVLESMNQEAASLPDVPVTDDQPSAAADVPAADTPAVSDAPTVDAPVETPPADTPADSPVVEPVTTPSVADPITSVSTDAPELDSIKKVALEELRPLVDKLNLPADERFDTLLLLIRSTDDRTLVSAAHEAARNIEDEAKRAQALLDVIKEIDYFAAQK